MIKSNARQVCFNSIVESVTRSCGSKIAYDKGDYFHWDDELFQGDYTADKNDSNNLSVNDSANTIYVCPEWRNEYKSISGFRGHVLKKHYKPYKGLYYICLSLKELSCRFLVKENLLKAIIYCKLLSFLLSVFSNTNAFFFILSYILKILYLLIMKSTREDIYSIIFHKSWIFKLQQVWI